LAEEKKVGGSTSLAEHGSMVNTSVEVVRSVINGQDPKGKSMVGENAEIRMV
jgi:hypothetical protein